jgi:hypothetical protein
LPLSEDQISVKYILIFQFLKKLKQDIVADWCTEEDCAKTIRTTFEETGTILHPGE